MYRQNWEIWDLHAYQYCIYLYTQDTHRIAMGVFNEISKMLGYRTSIIPDSFMIVMFILYIPPSNWISPQRADKCPPQRKNYVLSFEVGSSDIKGISDQMFMSELKSRKNLWFIVIYIYTYTYTYTYTYAYTSTYFLTYIYIYTYTCVCSPNPLEVPTISAAFGICRSCWAKI